MEDYPPVVELRLPVPPSANQLFVIVGRKRVKSKDYVAWIQSLVSWIPHDTERLEKEKTPYHVRIYANISHRRDIDNLAKPVLDALVRQRIVTDDRWCDCLYVERTAEVEKDHLEVMCYYAESADRI